MADSLSAVVNDDHPLALELSSLRASATRYQHEAHATSIKLQRHSLEASQALDHARASERTNARLKEELSVLRANPDTTPAQASSQVPELTLALRRLSNKLTAVEQALLQRTKDVVDVRSELAGAHYQVEAARALAAEARAREEEGLARERKLEVSVRASEEERRMADIVVQEYADLVRKLEGRPKVPSAPCSVSSMDLQRSTSSSTTTLVDNLSEGRLGLQKLLEEFNGRNEQLQADIARLHGDNSLLYKELEVACHGAEHDRTELSKALHEIDKYRADDNTAAKMVSRYMKFSQSSTDTLQKAMNTLKLRHATTLATLNGEIAELNLSLSHEREESGRLRAVLDELTEDIAREAYGRRREVSLRLAFLGREENLAESLRRWVRKAKESLQRASGDSKEWPSSSNFMLLQDVFGMTISDAESLLEMLNGQPTMGEEELAAASIARLVLAQDMVVSLTHELQEETIRRLKAERTIARLGPVDHAEDAHDLDEARHLAHAVPHPVSENQQEKALLNGRDAPSVEAVSAVPCDNISARATALTDNVPIVEVITVPAVEGPSVNIALAITSVSDPPDQSGLSSGRPRPDESLGSPMLPLEDVLNLRKPIQFADLVPSELEGDKEEGPVVVDPIPLAVVIQHDELGTVTFTSITPNSASAASASSSLVASPSSVCGSSLDIDTPGQVNESPVVMPHVPPPLPIEATNASALCSPSLTSPSLAFPPSECKETSLLDGLARVKHRYDEVQRGFRDCHLALKELTRAITALPSPPSASTSEIPSVLRKAVDHLSDFNEDARVELEIRIADEERIASGYEALLSIPGAMAPSGDADVDNVDAHEIVQEARAFVDGTDRAVAKATQQFTQKLDDIEHDIASIKRTLHELASSAPEDAPSPASSARPHASPGPSWSAWTPSFLSPARSMSPAPPTFGSVMTSPRLRHSSSFSHPRERSAEDGPADPLASLGLRIVVPSPSRSPFDDVRVDGGLAVHGASRSAPRQRTTSGMFMLGLGMRSASFGSGMGRQGVRKVPSTSLLASSSTPRLASMLGQGSSQREGSGIAVPGEDDDDDDDVE